MWIVMLNGGLGNQMFQYIFALFLMQHGVYVTVDDAAFFGKHIEHNSYEAPLFFPDGGLPRLSERFSSDVWAEMVERRECGTSIPEQLREGGLSVRYVRQDAGDCPAFSGETIVVSAADATRILQLPRRQITYLAGYWMDFSYFKEIQAYFWSCFRFPPFPTEQQAETAQEISSVQNAAAIHVRRGDMARLGLSNPLEYFRKAVSELDRLIGIDRFFLFSDDLGYCMEHEAEIGLDAIRSRLTVVEGNCGAHAYVDMQLMSLCRFRIADRSSFSQLAGVLCRLPGNLTTVWKPPRVTGYSIPV